MDKIYEEQLAICNQINYEDNDLESAKIMIEKMGYLNEYIGCTDRRGQFMEPLFIDWSYLNPCPNYYTRFKHLLPTTHPSPSIDSTMTKNTSDAPQRITVGQMLELLRNKVKAMDT